MVTVVAGQRHIKIPNLTLRVAFFGAQALRALGIDAAAEFVRRISIPMPMTVTSSRRNAGMVRIREIGRLGRGLALPSFDSFRVFLLALLSHFWRINSKKGGQCIIWVSIAWADFRGGQFHKNE